MTSFRPSWNTFISTFKTLQYDPSMAEMKTLLRTTKVCYPEFSVTVLNAFALQTTLDQASVLGDVAPITAPTITLSSARGAPRNPWYLLDQKYKDDLYQHLLQSKECKVRPF